ncbi:MAG: hypothetical protein AB8I69_03410 [Anaerolineae bacterium]
MKHATTLLALGTLCLSLACSQAANSSSNTSTIDLAELLPPGTRFIEKVALDTDGDGREEWIIFYQFDLTNNTEDSTAPIGGIVYRAVGLPPPNLVAHCLLPNNWCVQTRLPTEFSPPVDNKYLCDGECSVEVEEIIAKAAGKEIVIRDKVGQETTKITIFSWTPADDACREGQYELRGQFSGDRVSVKENSDTVIVDDRSQEFALFAVRLTYSTEGTESFYEYQDVPFKPDLEMILFPEECDNVMHSPYPEKTVMAFYSHYNEETAQKYFAAGIWEQLGKCAGESDCGCSVPPDQVERVQVKGKPEAIFLTQNDTVVIIQVKCVHKNRNTDPETQVTWSLKRGDDGQWKITNLMPEETNQPTPPSSPITPSP